MKPRDLWPALLFIARCVFHLSAETLANNTQPFECYVDDPLACNQSKYEVCIFRSGAYSCQCPQNVTRSADGRCIVIDECAEERLNDCHQNAICIDKIEGYTCQCLDGFVDLSENEEFKPGRICEKDINECADPITYNIDCSENATCHDIPESFTCICNPGFIDISSHYSLLPGRKCVENVDECSNGTTNDCSPNADCIDQPIGYICKCKEGFIDTSVSISHYPGRQCIAPKEPQIISSQQMQFPFYPTFQSNCSMNQTCLNNSHVPHLCHCLLPGTLITSHGQCIIFNQTINHCKQQNDCDLAAICSNTCVGYKCQCPPGFLDMSPDPVRLPGRKCIQLINECGTNKHDCSPYATCTDTLESYLCKCNAEYIDVSSRYGLKPGRRCTQSLNHCANRLTNLCDENADCVTLMDNYTCICATGYFDVSNNAKLPAGRVCTLQTYCPVQPSDLVFLIDGSTSIGVKVFQNEILRFVKDFIDLFDISSEQTRVAVVQFSDVIRHEIYLNQCLSIQQLRDAISNIEYLKGATRTGYAIQYVTDEAFTENLGGRPGDSGISQIVIIITDGRSQDSVTSAVENAKLKGIKLFAVGVTEHVLYDELELISGSKSRTFVVNTFKDLNARLRSIIQKATCPVNISSPAIFKDIILILFVLFIKIYDGAKCSSLLLLLLLLSTALVTGAEENCVLHSHAGCDRSLNQICALKSGKPCCSCPMPFEQHPITRVCGGALCNPQIISSCPSPEICQMTPHGNHRCICPPNTVRDQKSGACTTTHKPSMMPGIMPNECGNMIPCKQNEHCIMSLTGRRVCQCLPGYVINSSGKCQPRGTCQPYLPNACDQRRNEECLPDDHGGFTCQCAANQIRHPITQICLVDECAAGTHDCDNNANCIDTDEGYICTCKDGYIDESPDQSQKPGRVCRKQIDECSEGIHNCSEYADCINLPKGFLCRCRENYVDFSPNPQHFGGTYCKPMINECANESLNTCNKNAICIDTMDGYKCQCKDGFIDHDEMRNPGRICQQENRLCITNQNDCDKHAKCIEKGTNEYICVCEPDYIDKSPEPSKPGRVCLERICSNPSKHDCHPAASCTEVAKPERYTCSCRNGYSDMDLLRPGRICKELVNECLNSSLNDCDPAATCTDLKEGYTCTCPPNSKDISPNSQKPGRKCSILVNECTNSHLNNCSRFADCIDREDGYECVCKTGYRDGNPAKPGTDCKLIVNECQSSNLNNCDKNAECIDTEEGYQCKCIPPYIDQNPSQPGTVCRKKGIPCGDTACQEELGEICSENQLCICPPGQKRSGPEKKCRPVESWSLPLLVIRQNTEELNYNDNLRNPQSDQYKELVSAFEKGIAESYANTSLKNGFVVAEVNEIARPSDFIKQWDKGILYNFTVNFVRGSVASPESVFTELLQYIAHRNNFEVGKSKQFISPYQANPFDNCYKSDCHPDAKCTATPTGYRCQCPETHRDLNPSKAGRDCVSYAGVNECERKEWNECDENARCIDEDYLYRCECIKPFVNAAPPGKLPGSVCHIDYCSDVNFCPANATCQNGEREAQCVCKEGYVDIRPSLSQNQPNYPEMVHCVLLQDVNECALGLTNCSAVAVCTDLRIGYECHCPNGYLDGNPSEPGRICAAQLCGLCNGHGDCIYNEATKNVTCSCVGGYTGEFCEIEPSKTLLLLFLILAVLLLLLSLCLCMYFCSRLRCFRRKPETSIGSGREILSSDYYSIPRAKLKRREVDDTAPAEVSSRQLQRYLDDGGSISGESSGSSVQFERRVITDITTHEIKKTIYHDPETGQAIYEVTATASSSAGDGGHSQFLRPPIEIESEQHAGEQYPRSESTSRIDGSGRGTIRESGSREYTATRTTRQMADDYDDKEAYSQEDEIDGAVFDRTTKLSTRHDFMPAEYGHGGVERRRNEMSTMTKSHETSYY